MSSPEAAPDRLRAAARQAVQLTVQELTWWSSNGCPAALIDQDGGTWVCDRPPHELGYHHDHGRGQRWKLDYVADNQVATPAVLDGQEG